MHYIMLNGVNILKYYYAYIILQCWKIGIIELDYDVISDIRRYLKLVDNTIAYV